MPNLVQARGPAENARRLVDAGLKVIGVEKQNPILVSGIAIYIIMFFADIPACSWHLASPLTQR